MLNLVQYLNVEMTVDLFCFCSAAFLKQHLVELALDRIVNSAVNNTRASLLTAVLAFQEESPKPHVRP